MGLFKRSEAVEEIEPQANMTADELERMVYATYQEKIDLAKQLESAKARIEQLEESLQEKATKLRAAEEFARQSESDRRSAEAKIEPLEQSKKQLQSNLKAQKHRKRGKGYRYPTEPETRPQCPRETRMRRNLRKAQHGKSIQPGFKHPARLR